MEESHKLEMLVSLWRMWKLVTLENMTVKLILDSYESFIINLKWLLLVSATTTQGQGGLELELHVLFVKRCSSLYLALHEHIPLGV